MFGGFLPKPPQYLAQVINTESRAIDPQTYYSRRLASRSPANNNKQNMKSVETLHLKLFNADSELDLQDQLISPKNRMPIPLLNLKNKKRSVAKTD